jgi:hypothetical protein
MIWAKLLPVRPVQDRPKSQTVRSEADRLLRTRVVAPLYDSAGSDRNVKAQKHMLKVVKQTNDFYSERFTTTEPLANVVRPLTSELCIVVSSVAIVLAVADGT